MSGLSEGIANGPSLQKDAQIWERPWTLEEMRQNSANWSLAADSGLFLFLQDFSQRMLSKTHEIEKQLDSLIRDTKATDSRLHSVFNDFLMLSNTQFIENRVYDEEVEENIPKTDGPEKLPEQEKTREQKEAELIPKMQAAVNYGLKVLDSAFEHLDIKAGNSDSEDEEVTDKVEAILEPKDLYVDRPLPYLIGSQAFMEQDDVGLGDLSSDEVSVDSDRDSVLESEDGKEVVQSDEDLDQEEEISHNNIKKKSSMVSYDEEDEDSDIFGESDGDDDDDDEDNTGTAGPPSFAEELAARIKGDAVMKPESDRASLASKKKSKSKKEPKPSKLQAEEDDDDMFKPPKMDDDDFSPFGGKGGLFSGGRGLFDDDDEGDLFSDAPKPPASEDKNLLNESSKSTAHAAESDKPGKKIPTGGISVFPENKLFVSGNDSDSVGSKENGTPAPHRQVPSAAGFGGGGLFEDDDEDDDFFGGKSTKKSGSTGPEKTKKSIDLFADDDEDGDIFSEKYSTPSQSKKEAAVEPTKPEKKMPAGAISMFGPGTKSLLSEGLKKRRLSTSEESEKSEENGSTQDVGKAAVKQPQKPQTRGLFSDDEDTGGFPAIPKSRSKPEPTSQGKTSKAASLLFDDEEEEDLFATAAKSNPKSNQAKASPPQPTKAVSSSLFSDDEDQWMTSKSSAGKPEVKSGGMKSSTSAPSSLPSTKSSHNSLFVDADDEDDDDLFTPKQESSQQKAQRVSLLFEDEDDEYDGSLFGIKSAVNKNAAPPANTPAVSSQTSSRVSKPERVAAPAEDKPLEQNKQKTDSPETVPSSPLTESSESKKNATGGVSLFGGIDVVGSKLLDGAADGFLSGDSSPLNMKKEDKVTRNTFSLFDDDEEDKSDWNKPIFTPSKPNTKNTLKPAEEQPQAKSTGVFQDEELLFSQTQQKDNDPDVDLFATSGKASSSKVSLAKPAAQSLFADEDEEDDLFSSVKPKAPPPKVSDKPSKPDHSGSGVDSLLQKSAASPLKARESSSRIGKLQASLMINPAALLPGAAPSLPGAVSVLPGTAPKSSSGTLSSSSSSSSSGVLPPAGTQTGSDQGVSFDAPVQVTTLQSAHKTRAKIAAQRRPQSRAARQQAAKASAADEDAALSNSWPSGPSLPSSDQSSRAASVDFLAAFASSVSEAPPRPLNLTLPGANNAGKDESAKGSSSTKVLQVPEDDLFAPDGLFGPSAASDVPPARKTAKTTQHQATGDAGQKKEKDRSTFPSIFEDNSDDLFQTSKPRLTNKKVKAASFLEEDEDDEDIFRVSNTSTPTSTSSKEVKNSSSYSKLDIFQDEVTTVPKVQKKHKLTTDASLFDDNIDIFADLTDTVKPKQKSKSKGETKSIFDDDMDDIFSSSTIKAVTKVSSKAKKTPVIQETSPAADASSIFDDPLNAVGGN